ncbi:ATP-binding cassette domain-containing protein, partial [Bacillus sp. SRB1LM]|uniref:ATP-binding cassette domain-containing protein n=1 Tax=Bacillus sp. SRB1LM TaxID=2608688 RepID=UPI0018C438B0
MNANTEVEIELDKVNKLYGDRFILKDFNLKVFNNEFIGIIGNSGTGKSTLLNIIGLLEKTDNGKVIVQGNNNPYRNKKMLFRNTFGYIFQNYALMDNETVGSNLEVALHFQKLKKQKKQELMKKALD